MDANQLASPPFQTAPFTTPSTSSTSTKYDGLIQKYYSFLTRGCPRRLQAPASPPPIADERHTPLCALYLHRYEQRRGDIQLPEVSRLAIVLASTGPGWLKCGSQTSWMTNDAEAAKAITDSHSFASSSKPANADEEEWSADHMPGSYRRGWEEFTDSRVRRLVSRFVNTSKLPLPPPAEQHSSASPITLPQSWSDSFSASSHLRCFLVPAAGESDPAPGASAPGLDLHHLHRLSIALSEQQLPAMEGWAEFLDQFTLGLESIHAGVVPILLSFFFLWDPHAPPPPAALPPTPAAPVSNLDAQPFHCDMDRLPIGLAVGICELLHRLPSSAHPEIARWILAHKGTPNRAQGVVVIQRLVAGIHATISACYRPCSNLEDVDDENEDEGAVVDPGAMHAIKALKVVDIINRKYSLLPYAALYHPDINAYFSPRAEYLRWKSSLPVSTPSEPQPLALAHYPFILNPASKSDLLRIESLVHMRHHLQATFFRALFVGVQSPYLDLVVRRDHAVRDTLVQLAGVSDRRDLRKQLRVSFVGEPGVDEGGVGRELLALVMRGLLDPVYGMFTAVGKGNAVAWFVPDVVAFANGEAGSGAAEADGVAAAGSMPDSRVEEEYELAGKVCGVALYNSIVLQVHFPLVLFKKLLGEPLTIDDLAEIDPQLAQGLRTLATFQGDVQSTYCRTFTVEEEHLGGGGRTVVKLVPNGASVDLTNDNRKEYICQMLDYHLNVRVSRAYQSFQRGFAAVTAESSIKHLFRAEELHHVVLGEEELDIDALETQAIYDGGYSHETPIVESLWHAIRSMSSVDQRRFLFFVTGTDRAPVGGLGRVTIVVMRQGPDSDRLPSAHTCFNVLLLPEYSSPSKLEGLLKKALENIEGFGLM